MFNEPLSPSFSTTPSSPPYSDLTSNYEHYGLDNPDPTSLNLKDLQATSDSERTQIVPEPSEPFPEPSEPIPEPYDPKLTLPTFDEALAKFSEISTSRFKNLFVESSASDNPSEVRTN